MAQLTSRPATPPDPGAEAITRLLQRLVRSRIALACAHLSAVALLAAIVVGASGYALEHPVASTELSHDAGYAAAFLAAAAGAVAIASLRTRPSARRWLVLLAWLPATAALLVAVRVL